MDNPFHEAMDYTVLANIRVTIRRVILPLVQAIYDENPSDVILFCSGYFNNLLQKREGNFQDMNASYSRECSQKEEELPEITESKETKVFPTTIQESASDPVLTKSKKPECVNLKGKKRSSWDTPSKILEPIESVAILKDAAFGVGDKSSRAENQMDLENHAKAGDTDSRLKDDSAYEDDSFSEYTIVDEIKNDSTTEEDLNSSHSCHKSTDEDLEALCTQFESIKTKISDTSKLDESRHEDFDQGTVSKKDIKICKKQLSPNSSFGFVPHLNESDSKEELKKMDAEDVHNKNLKIKTEEISMIAKEVFQTFHSLAEKNSCTETNINSILQNAKEMSDVIQGQNNVGATNFINKSDKTSKCKEDFIVEKEKEMISRSSDKHSDVTVENSTHAKKIDDDSLTFKADDTNIPEYSNPREIGYRKTRRNYQEEKFPSKDKSVITHRNSDEDDRDRHADFESRTVLDKLWRKWYEAHPSLDNLNSSQRSDPRLFRAHFLAGRSSIGEAGDVALDRIYFSNEASNDMDNHSRNQSTSEPPIEAGENSCSRFSSDETSDRSDSARPSDKLPERKTSYENISSANSLNIPYSWMRKLSKQSHSSENVVRYTKESQTELKEETNDSVKPERKEDRNPFKETEKASGIKVVGSEEIFFEASDEIHEKTKLGIKELKDRKSKQSEDKNKDDVFGESVKDQSLNILDAEQEILPETDLSIDSKEKTQSSPILHEQDSSIPYQGVTETVKETQDTKQYVTNGNCEVEKKHFVHYGISPDARKDKEVNQNNNHPMKDEYELNAACGCGDFVYTMNDVNEQNTNSQTNTMEPDENIINEQNDESLGEISLEYLGEVIERAIEQQNNDSMDTYEGLDFSHDTEDDSSGIESSDDFSETDDFSFNDSMQENTC